MIKILAVEDDPPTLKLLEMVFRHDGAGFVAAHNGLEGIRQFIETKPDVVLLDLTMPEMDGWETCRRIREISNTPIVILTAQSRDLDVVRGLDLGADDYIIKPFKIDVLRARVRAVLRRSQQAGPPPEQPRGYRDERVTIDLVEHRVTVEGNPIRLTATESKLLTDLVENAGRIVTTRELLSSVWGWPHDAESDPIRLYIMRLRHKLEQDPKNPQLILTEYGIGYRFESAGRSANATR
ncbi:MAG: response regulator transcription factor [Anaerolineales bacterium]|nr:response regulator transcription factor [Anaerolineales bacterium]